MVTPCSSNKPPLRPFVLVNMAMTSDGKIATANRRVTSFGSAHDQAHLHHLRQTADAILCGAETVRAAGVTLATDLPGATDRRPPSERARPLRVVVSGSARLPQRPGLLHQPGSPLVVICSHRAPAAQRRQLAAQGITVRVLGRHRVDLVRALTWLARDYGVRRLLCEGGARLNAGLLYAGLVDQVHLTVCPWIVGGTAAPSLADGPARRCLAQVFEGRLVSHRTVGAEQYLVYALSSARRAISQSRSDKRLRKIMLSSLPS